MKVLFVISRVDLRAVWCNSRARCWRVDDPRAQSNRGQLQISEHVQAVKLDSLFGQVMHAMSEVEGNLISGRENARR